MRASEFTGHRFFRIAINPNDPNTIFAATSNGLFLSKDGGGTWALLTNGLPAISATIMGVSDVVIDPSTPAVVYAAFWGDGIYKTTSGNAANPTWTRLAGGLPNPTPSRVGLGISASSP